MPNPRGIGGFEKGSSGNLGGRPKQRPFREALLAEAALADAGNLSKAPKGSLRWIARQLPERAGKETAAMREIANRLDGPPEAPPQVEVSGDKPVTSVEVTFVVPGTKPNGTAGGVRRGQRSSRAGRRRKRRPDLRARLQTDVRDSCARCRASLRCNQVPRPDDGVLLAFQSGTVRLCL
jgi:hypothetical protein